MKLTHIRAISGSQPPITDGRIHQLIEPSCFFIHWEQPWKITETEYLNNLTRFYIFRYEKAHTTPGLLNIEIDIGSLANFSEATEVQNNDIDKSEAICRELLF